MTFSVSVDAETREALRALAKSDFDGNVSAVITSLAAKARRQLAARAFLRRHGIPIPTVSEAAEIQAEIDAEVAAARKKAKKRRVSLMLRYVFDTGALVAAERRKQRATRFLGMAAVGEAEILVPLPVVAGWWRGRTAIRVGMLAWLEIVADVEMTKAAGVALGTLRNVNATLMIDAIVMATAAARDGMALSHHFPSVALLSVETRRRDLDGIRLTSSAGLLLTATLGGKPFIARSASTQAQGKSLGDRMKRRASSFAGSCECSHADDHDVAHRHRFVGAAKGIADVGDVGLGAGDSVLVTRDRVAARRTARVAHAAATADDAKQPLLAPSESAHTARGRGDDEAPHAPRV